MYFFTTETKSEMYFFTTYNFANLPQNILFNHQAASTDQVIYIRLVMK